jgi:hypothetical protein
MNLLLPILLLTVLGFSQTLTDFIVIDQFGYREQAKKIAVIRVPQQGFDSPSNYTPGNNFQVINEASKAAVFSGTPIAFNGGQTDAASGDKIWYFDFSSVTTPGSYYVLDQTNNHRSYSFRIANDVYNNVLKAAIKMFYYQRAGTDKPAQYAGESWADGSNFLQDEQTRDFFKKNDASTARDLRGGWFDAGDYNKYTKWTADYVENMLFAYEENPEAFTDDYGIPESGNGVPDIIDEAKWGIEWLLKMQNENGSALSVQGLSGGKSPPSTVTGPSYYGPPNTTATLGVARAFAVASRFFKERGETTYAEDLKIAAIKAWDWAEAYPDSIFHNNCDCPNYDSRELAAGDQEINDSWDRDESRISAALALYELTGEEVYLTIFENDWVKFPLHAWGGCMQQYRYSQHTLLIRYLNASYGKTSVKNAIKNDFTTAFAKPVPDNCNHFGNGYQSDGYRSYIYDYQWGSNKVKADHGLTYYKWNIIDPSKDYKDVAEDYLHYIHGVNPFNMVYLTNMNGYGASRSVTTIYHDWFSEKSAKWGIATSTNPGPAPGYMPGGPNSGFKKDDCCTDGTRCYGDEVRFALCSQIEIPVSQPHSKMYKDINHGWPINTWEITEPSDGYQLSYIRLLSKFVAKNGTVPVKKQRVIRSFEVVQSKNSLQIMAATQSGSNLQAFIYNSNGKLLVKKQSNSGSINIDLQNIPHGMYIVQISNGSVKESRIIAK